MLFSNKKADVVFSTIEAGDSPAMIERKILHSINNVEKKIKEYGQKIEDINNQFIDIEEKTQKELSNTDEAEANIVTKVSSIKGGTGKGNIEILTELEKAAHFITLRKKRLKEELGKLSRLIYEDVNPAKIIPISIKVDQLLIDRDRLEKKIDNLRSSISIGA